ncbi:hypothetical protein [Acetobacterium woodii]|uniref:Uncharacterized protein n=1 Tax=Acetobacterium woodii (strain ATCC 29683 / DSM 1030 / JCM 2381 / KCTC 1655 / WB1) TaxID=931626 RepID=H6LJB8_ACEWD|nr:hypothetical protein [Acetobacterium woodii]AFA48681.1 hypothetical protein Awo_c19020 [Acetobacterium woodii DSM 1030]
MALQEVKRFINYLNENRKALEKYNQQLQISNTFLYSEPVIVSTGYYVSPMIPESVEDDLLQKIIKIDEIATIKLKKLNDAQGIENSFSEKVLRKFDEMFHPNENIEDRILDREEAKRHKLFEKLAELAKEDGFDISTDDLLYFIGKAVLVEIKEHPDYDETQIFDEILKTFN